LAIADSKKVDIVGKMQEKAHDEVTKFKKTDYERSNRLNNEAIGRFVQRKVHTTPTNTASTYRAIVKDFDIQSNTIVCDCHVGCHDHSLNPRLFAHCGSMCIAQRTRMIALTVMIGGHLDWSNVGQNV
jgi:hypothetical protein